jgi:hypothetical protein
VNAPRSAARTWILGLVRRRTVWVPTWRLWVLLAVCAALGLYSLRGLHAFLSLTAPVEASVLVVEGWLPDYALAESKNEFERHGYDLIITTGGPLERGSFLANFPSYADLGSATLRKLGLKPNEVQPAPARSSRRDRTYAAAMGLKAWLMENSPRVRSMNVVTLGVHARRSRMMYQHALGDDYQIGIIALRDRDYEPESWWLYSAGLKEIMTEGAAYVHAKLFFYPELEHFPPPFEQP